MKTNKDIPNKVIQEFPETKFLKLLHLLKFCKLMDSDVNYEPAARLSKGEKIYFDKSEFSFQFETTGEVCGGQRMKRTA